MKQIIFTLCMLLASVNLVAQESESTFNIEHGPYLQALTTNSVVVSFATSARALAAVEVREKGCDAVETHYMTKDGLRMAYSTHNNVAIDGLKPATEYEYRVVAKPTLKYRPYDIRFGEEVQTPWYEFRAFAPDAEEFTFVATSDIHDRAEMYEKLLAMHDLESAEAMFLVGDIVCDISREYQAYASVIDSSTNLFARHTPLYLIRGNHEVRGSHCRDLDLYFHKINGRYYSLQRFGSTAVLMLDSGEDKADASPVFNGVKELEQYVDEEIEWLREAVRSKEWRKAKHRIVMIHIPPISAPMRRIAPLDEILCWGSDRWGEKALDIFNKADIDLMISGHTHQFNFIPAHKGEQNYPLVINDHRSAMSVKVAPQGIDVEVINIDGEVLLKEHFQ